MSSVPIGLGRYSPPGCGAGPVPPPPAKIHVTPAPPAYTAFPQSNAGNADVNSSGEASSETARETMILKWLPLVRVIAAGQFQRLGSLRRLLVIDWDDLVQTGIIGLIAAVDHFKPELAEPRVYFTRRIQGAIWDYLRSFPYFRKGEPVLRADESDLALQACACAEIERVEVHVDFERLASSLPARHQAVIREIVRGTPQNQIARLFGVNESRVSQIKSECLAALRLQTSRASSIGSGA